MESNQPSATNGNNAAYNKEKLRIRFSSGRFLVSPAGILKILEIILFSAASIVFLTSNLCPDSPSWYGWLYPMATLIAAGLTAIIYGVFALGLGKQNPVPWATVDIILCLVLALSILIISILTTMTCSSSDSIYLIPGPLGIVGSILLMTSAAATYIKLQYKKDEAPTQSPLDALRSQSRRKSSVDEA